MGGQPAALFVASVLRRIDSGGGPESHAGPVIASGFTQRSKSSALT